jgi:hypothetical protein
VVTHHAIKFVLIDLHHFASQRYNLDSPLKSPFHLVPPDDLTDDVEEGEDEEADDEEPNLGTSN